MGETCKLRCILTCFKLKRGNHPTSNSKDGYFPVQAKKREPCTYFKLRRGNLSTPSSKEGISLLEALTSSSKEGIYLLQAQERGSSYSKLKRGNLPTSRSIKGICLLQAQNWEPMAVSILDRWSLISASASLIADDLEYTPI